MHDPAPASTHNAGSGVALGVPGRVLEKANQLRPDCPSSRSNPETVPNTCKHMAAYSANFCPVQADGPTGSSLNLVHMMRFAAVRIDPRDG
jgi:hypothetical protein